MAKPSIAIIAIIISCLTILAGFYWQHQFVNDQQQQQKQIQHTQTAEVIQSGIEDKIVLYQHQIQILSESNLIQNSLNNPQQLQKALSASLPDVEKACFFPAHIDEPDPNACIPVSFATLENLRAAKTNGNAPMAVMKSNEGKQYLLMAQRISNAEGQTRGVLAVTFSPKFLSALLRPSYGKTAYIELQQGNNTSVGIITQGDNKWRQALPLHQQAIKNSHWQIAYWPEEQALSVNYLLVASLVILMVLLMWLLREQGQRYIVTHDVSVLKNQLSDLNHDRLKASYPTVVPEMEAVVDEIKRLGTIAPLKKKRKAPQQAETAIETIEQELDEPLKAADENDPVTAMAPTPENIENTSTNIDFAIQKTDEPEPDRGHLELEPQIEVTPKIFKAYDIRGIVDETLDADVIRTIGQAIGSEALDKEQSRIAVGRDGRLTSEEFSQALVEGIMSTGCNVVDIGEVPTPLLSFACEHLNTHSGVMVTASHNPANYNGLKVTLAGKPIFGAALQQLYQRILQGNIRKGQGQYSSVDLSDDYTAKVASDINLVRPLKVVVDCGNGVAGSVVPKVLTALGCEVIELYCDVDGTFPNHHPNPSEPANLQDLILAVKRSGSELGLAFDGDGDRLGTVDAEGNIIWSDRLMIMFAQDILPRMPGSLVIYDVKSTSLLGDAITGAGGEALMWQSGYAMLRDKLQETGAPLAGEMSGHIFFNDRWYGFDDAIYTACRLVELLARDPLERNSAAIFASIPDRESTPEIIVDMEELECQKFVQQFVAEASFTGAKISTVDGLRADFPNGWGLVRASNTVPGLTLRFEADTADALLDIQQQFKQQMLQVKPTITLLF